MRTFIALEKLVEISERKTARMMGITLKQYRAERDKLIDTLGLNDEEIQSKRRARTRNKDIP